MSTRDASWHSACEHASDGVGGEPRIDMEREAQVMLMRE
jgi:hypothetical protein